MTTRGGALTMRDAAPGVVLAILTACAAGARAPASSAAPVASSLDGALLDPAPRAEIDALDRQIADDLTALELAPVAAPACAVTG